MIKRLREKLVSGPTEDTAKTPAPPQQSPSPRRPKIGLALGAGVARGWAHIGVVKRLAEEGIEPDVIAGTSVGAVVGGAIASNNLPALEEWARDLKRHNFWRFLDWKLGAAGLFGGGKLKDLMVERFGGYQIENLPIPFTAVACELKTGHEVWLNKGPMADAIQASFALPGVFEPKRIDRRWLVDGALVNPTPVSVCRAAGCDMVIAVNLAEDLYGRRHLNNDDDARSEYGVFAEIASSPSVLGRSDAGQVFRKLFRHRENAPSLFANMVASLSILQNRLSRSRLAGDPPDVTITPRVGHIGLMEFHRANELIDEGIIAFNNVLPYLKDARAVITHRMNG